MFTFVAVAAALFLFLGMLICIEIGWRVARRHSRLRPGESSDGVKAIEAALFALLGLLLAFTFSGAASRFDSRRHLVVEEANLISTAYLRLDVLAPASRDELKELFRNYLDLRITTYRQASRAADWKASFAASQEVQKKIWERAVKAVQSDAFSPSAILLLPVINGMFDIATTRIMWTRMHPPVVIFLLLYGLGLACALVAGYSVGKDESRRWIHVIGFAFVISFTSYVILDLEFPRLGFIKVVAFDQALADLRAGMK
jgi:hypothetical protein